jgi:hypothetical protein
MYNNRLNLIEQLCDPKSTIEYLTDDFKMIFSKTLKAVNGFVFGTAVDRAYAFSFISFIDNQNAYASSNFFYYLLHWLAVLVS